MRLWPRSMLGQVLLVVALALFVAQGISAALLIKGAQNRRDAAVLNAAALQFVRQAEPRDGAARDRAARDRAARDRRRERNWRGDTTLRPRMPRPMRLEWTDRPAELPGDRRLPDRETALRTILEGQGVSIEGLRVGMRRVAEDPVVQSRPRLQRRIARQGFEDGEILVAALKRSSAEQWAVARVPTPAVEQGVRRTIIVQTVLIYLFLIGLLYILIRRIARPLASLAERTERFSGAVPEAEPLAERGPEDVKRLIRAHNGMEARVAALLDEKDVMLGAIGHDLKTPLAALRVRIESVEDEAQRTRMAASIEDITQTLDDILSLARVGKAGDPPEKTDLAALAAAVVEEFEDMGRPVTLADTARLSRPVHMTWLKRALRNLVSNAVRYGGTARVSVLERDGAAILQVEDEGPGIPESRIADMLEPFRRGEASRNRATGGAGLGLTLARAIAEQHRGELVLENRQGRSDDVAGLRAEIRLPM